MLARTVGCSLDDCQGLAARDSTSRRPIFQEKDGRLISPHLRQEASKQRKYRKLQAEKSKKGVEARVTSPTPTLFRFPLLLLLLFSKEKENTHTLLKKEGEWVCLFSRKGPESRTEADLDTNPQACTPSGAPRRPRLPLNCFGRRTRTRSPLAQAQGMVPAHTR